MNPVAELTDAQKVVYVSPNDLPGRWEQVQPLLDKACGWSNGQFTWESVLDGLLDGRFHMIAYVDEGDILSIAILTLSEYGTGLRMCEVLLASGEGLKDWVHFEDKVAAWAKAQGCSRFRMIGRDGLQRMLKHWKRTAIVLEREFD